MSQRDFSSINLTVKQWLTGVTTLR